MRHPLPTAALALTAATAALLTPAIGPATGAPQAPAAAAKPLLQMDLTKGNDGWAAFGEGAKVSVADQDGQKALQFDYAVEKGKLHFLYLPLAQNEISTTKSIRFAVRSDYSTTLGCVLQEAGGGRYMALFHAPGGAWQEVALAPADFLLLEGDTNPEDPNDRLDLNQVEGVGLADFGQIAAQSGNATLIDLFGIKTGARTLHVRDFTIRRDPLPGSASFGDAAGAPLDVFTRPQIGWVAVGAGASLTPAAGKPLPGRGLQLRYDRAKAKLGGVLRMVPHGWLDQREKMTLRIASDKPATLVVEVEEHAAGGGGKYNTLLHVPGGGEASEYTVSFAEFKPSQESQDSNKRLDLYHVRHVLILDITGMTQPAEEGKPADNTLWIGDTRSVKPSS